MKYLLLAILFWIILVNTLAIYHEYNQDPKEIEALIEKALKETE